MTRSIARLYDNEASAQRAVAELKKSGFASESVTLVTPKDAKALPGEEGRDSLASAIATTGLSKSESSFYEERVRGGASFVSVTPAWGTGQKATRILDECDPLDVEVPQVEDARAVKTEQAPVSSEAAPLSAKLNMPVLLDDAAPFSSYFKWPVLWDRAAPLSEKANWSTLSDNPTPLSSWLKLPVLLNDPAPLSEKLNVPTVK